MLKVDEYIDGLKLFRISNQEGSFKSRGVEYLWDPSKIDVVTKEMEHGYMNFFIISNNQQNDYKKVICKLSCVWDEQNINTENDYYNFCVDLSMNRYDILEEKGLTQDMVDHIDMNMIISKIGFIDIKEQTLENQDIKFV
tara:strand:- start:438 stop:857 length:420 start_codon:yes stop_codon:yes gene_type:complete